jgi:glycosyltransferase involved in cell wall biosynthesis
MLAIAGYTAHQSSRRPAWLHANFGLSLKILVITSEFPSARLPNRASFNRQHLAALSDHHEIHVVCPVPWLDYLRSRDKADDFRAPEHLNPRVQVDYLPYFYPPGVLRGSHAACMWASLRSQLGKIAKRLNPDLVLGIWAFPDGAVALRLGRALGVPTVIQVLGSDINLLEQYPAKRARTLAALGGADRVITVSDALREKLILEGLSEEKLSVVYRGVNTQLFQPREQPSAQRDLGLAPGPQRILCIGNLVPVKNPGLLLQSYLEAEFNRGTELHFLGDGPLREALASKAVNAAPGKRVHFHGSISHGDIPVWMAAADLLVLSSDAEGVPNVLFEARTIGCPYVATRVGGVPEVSTHMGAMLVEAGNVESMRSALEDCIGSTRLSREPAPWQSWQDAGRNLARVLEEVSEGKPCPV